METLSIILFIAGPFVLVFGAELLVRGAARLASALGMSPLVIGLTVVSFGTSAPELAVSLNAGFDGRGEIAIGNVIGSNILNVLLVLGLAALVAPLSVHRQLIQKEVPLMVGASILVFLMAMDGSFQRLEGVTLFIGIIAFTAFALVQNRRALRRSEDDEPSRTPVPLEIIFRQVVLVGVGLAALVIGGQWIVDGAVILARSFGVSELIIGLTIVAVGTSLPEVATSIVAGLRGQTDIAVGNVVGSNIFNLLAVLGTTVMLVPDGITVPAPALRFDLPVMVAVAVACLPVFFTGGRINRWEGAMFLAYLGAYLAYLSLDAVGHSMLPAFSRAMLFFVIPLTAATILVITIHYIRVERRQASSDRR